MGKGATVQDVFQLYGEKYLVNYNPPSHVWKAARAITNCRTQALGGHVDKCECGYTRISYNSCRNRHCPKCQALSKERWIMARKEELLPVQYFHIVFTLPHELSGILMQNQKSMYNLLFKAAQETIRTLARDKKYLGAEIGLTSILHTWGQNLTFHPHVHMIVPGGGLTPDGKWKTSRKKFFIPVKVMSKLFRGKFLYYLRQEKLTFCGNEKYLDNPNQFASLIASLYKKDWYIYCKAPFKTPTSVLEYLGRYTHRIAISDHRIISVANETVSFKYRDYQDGNKAKIMSLPTNEFMRRFLMHVLPPQFTKIRHYGLLASAIKGKKLALCRKLIGVRVTISSNTKLNPLELIKLLTGVDITVCPQCGQTLTRASPTFLIA